MVNEVNFSKVPHAPTRYQNVDAVNQRGKIPQKTGDDQAGQSGDIVMISNEGLNAQEIMKYRKIVDKMPDNDQEKIQEVKKRVQAGTYFTPDVAYKTAGKLLEALQR